MNIGPVPNDLTDVTLKHLLNALRDGVAFIGLSGTTANRPTDRAFVGLLYWDTDLTALYACSAISPAVAWTAV
jgi:hypothetical protein